MAGRGRRRSGSPRLALPEERRSNLISGAFDEEETPEPKPRPSLASPPRDEASRRADTSAGDEADDECRCQHDRQARPESSPEIHRCAELVHRLAEASSLVHQLGSQLGRTLREISFSDCHCS